MEGILYAFICNTVCMNSIIESLCSLALQIIIQYHHAYTGTPKHIDYEELRESLMKVEGVKRAHSLYVWSLTLNRTALSAHLVLGNGILKLSGMCM